VSERAVDGDTIGWLVPRSATIVEDLVRDGRFTYSGDTYVNHYAAGSNIGDAGGAWYVDSGDVGVETDWPDTPLGGEPIDLDGTTPGSISQTLNTVAGQRYQLNFLLSGNFSDGLPKTLTVSAGDSSATITVVPPTGWAFDNPLWNHRSMEFTATSATTTLSFTSGCCSNACSTSAAGRRSDAELRRRYWQVLSRSVHTSGVERCA